MNEKKNKLLVNFHLQRTMTTDDQQSQIERAKISFEAMLLSYASKKEETDSLCIFCGHWCTKRSNCSNRFNGVQGRFLHDIASERERERDAQTKALENKKKVYSSAHDNEGRERVMVTETYFADTPMSLEEEEKGSSEILCSDVAYFCDKCSWDRSQLSEVKYIVFPDGILKPDSTFRMND
jgi:hypothetical protein